jgi:hypothetical protein
MKVKWPVMYTCTCVLCTHVHVFCVLAVSINLFLRFFYRIFEQCGIFLFLLLLSRHAH